jgi:alcohol dehydrogenase/propanol-preferring alcohol dehydrogenase
MQSCQIHEFGKALRLVEAKTPAPRGTELLLRVRACGVCHSDVHLRDGFFDLGGGRQANLARSVAPPRTPGHEIVGEVVARGAEATGIEIGDLRAVFPWIGCGDCDFCRTGDEQLCANPRSLGVNRDGGYSDHVIVPHSRYLIDPSSIPEELACTYACSGLTAYSALKKAGKPGTAPLVLIGAGGVGLAAVRLAKTVTGAAPIVADLDTAKRRAASRAGAIETIDPVEEGAAKRFLKATGGARAVIDFVGSTDSAAFGAALLGKGGKLVIVGLYGGTFSLPIPFFPLKAISVEGSYAGSLKEMRELFDLTRAGELPPFPLESRPLAEANASLDDLKAGRIVGRVVLKP